MRVFTAVRHANDPRQYYGGLWSANFYPALRDLGCEIVESQVDLLPTSRFMEIADGFTPEELAARGETTTRILDEVRAAHREHPLDLFLSYFYNAHFDPAGFAEIERLGIPTVNFYCNSIYQFNLVAAVAAKVGFSWFPERDATSRYALIGARGVRVQMGADPDLCRPSLPDELPREAAACFIGQCYADRDRLAAALAQAAVPLALYGAGWGASDPATRVDDGEKEPDSYLGRPRARSGSKAAYLAQIAAILRAHGPGGGLTRIAARWQYRRVSARLRPLLAPHARGRAGDMAATLARHAVALNFSNVWADGQPGSALIAHVRLRDFEAPMCGACYLTGHTEEIAEFYEIGREIDTYRSADELIDKTRFYLKNPVAAESLRQSGGARARRDHTWRQRFSALFQKIGLR